MSLVRFSGSLSARKTAHFVGSGLLAGEVEREAAEEGGVAGRRARRHLERLQSLEQLVVDEVAPLDLGEVERQAGIDHRGEPGIQDVRSVAHDQVGLGAIEEADAALKGHRSGHVVIHLERSQPGHIATVPVGIISHHAELSRAGFIHPDGAGRLDADAGHRPMRLAAMLGRPVADPGEEGLVLRGAERCPGPADVRHAAGRLGQEEALFGREPRQPALAGVAHHRLVVAGRVVAEQREMEAVLPFQPAVAGAGIAPQTGQDRHDVLAEIPGAGRSRLDRDLRLRRRRRRPGHRGADRHDPGRLRPEIAAGLDRGQARRLRRPPDLRRPIAGGLGFLRRQELQTGIICRYGERLGRDPDPNNRLCRRARCGVGLFRSRPGFRVRRHRPIGSRLARRAPRIDLASTSHGHHQPHGDDGPKDPPATGHLRISSRRNDDVLRKRQTSVTSPILIGNRGDWLVETDFFLATRHFTTPANL